MPVDDMSYKIVPRKVSTFGGQGGKKYDLEEKVRTRGGGGGGAESTTKRKKLRL